MSRRAVVTGGGGFVGSHLCGRLLSEGWDVVCFDSFLTAVPSEEDRMRLSPRILLCRLDSKSVRMDAACALR